MAVRRALRLGQFQNERLIGWRPVQVPTTLSRALLRAAMAMLPGVGPAALALAGDRDDTWRLLVLTDRRLILIRPASSPGGPVVETVVDLGRLGVTCPAEGRFDLTVAGGAAVTVLVTGRQSPGGRCIVKALAAMSESGDPAGLEDSAETGARSLGRAVAGTTAALARSSYGELLGRWPIDRQ